MEVSLDSTKQNKTTMTSSENEDTAMQQLLETGTARQLRQRVPKMKSPEDSDGSHEVSCESQER